MRSDFILAMHTYIPEQTVALAKYYRNLINMVKGILPKRVICVLKLRISCNLARILIQRNMQKFQLHQQNNI